MMWYDICVGALETPDVVIVVVVVARGRPEAASACKRARLALFPLPLLCVSF